MSRATKDILDRVRQMVPPMLEKFHKYHIQTLKVSYILTRLRGQMGRIAVIGGSEDYTGAPYFSAMASARLGADMVSYSPFLGSRLQLTQTSSLMLSVNHKLHRSSRPTAQI